MIQDGTFTIYNDEGQELARVGKGSCFGELALLRKARSVPNAVLYAAGLHACGGRGWGGLPSAVHVLAVAAHAAWQHGYMCIMLCTYGPGFWPFVSRSTLALSAINGHNTQRPAARRGMCVRA